MIFRSNTDPRYIFHAMLLLVACLCFSGTVRASACKTDIVINDSVHGTYLTTNSTYLVDPEITITMEDIRSGNFKGEFQTFSRDSANFGVSTSAYWVRTSVCNDMKQTANLFIEVLNPFYDFIHVYIISNNKLAHYKKYSIHDFAKSRVLKYRRIIIPAEIKPNTSYEIYINMQPDGKNLMDLSMRLWTTDTLIEQVQTDNILWGIFYGGLIVMMLYNVFIYFTIRDSAYLYYVAYLFSFLLAWLSVSGHGSLYFWPDVGVLLQVDSPIFTAFTVIFSALFSRQFLGTDRTGGLNDKIILLTALFALPIFLSCIGVVFITDPALRVYIVFIFNFFMWNVGIVPLIYLYVGYRVYRGGYQPARYYLVAWAFLLAGTGMFTLLQTSIVKISLITEMAGPFGALIEASLLSFALADRIRILQQEKTETESKLVQAQIEPHFLFNTLANISSLMDSNVTRAKKMLNHLDAYLRTTLTRTRKDKSTLGQELALLESYLSIIHIRMGERLEYQIKVPDALYGIHLSPLLLQPLVENAIKHGLEPKTAGGSISITGLAENNRLILEVSDNGIGITDNWFTGTGLSNVHERVRLLYGSTGKLEIVQNSHGGVTSRLTIPAS